MVPRSGYFYYVDGKKTEDSGDSPLNEMVPGLSAFEILQRIFREAGYTVKGGFLTEETNPIVPEDLQDAVILGGRKPALSDEELTEAICNPYLTIDNQLIYNGAGVRFGQSPITPPSFQTVNSASDIRVKDILFRDDLNQWSESQQVFIAQDKGTYNIKVNIPLKPIFRIPYTGSLATNFSITRLRQFQINYTISVFKTDGTTKTLSSGTISGGATITNVRFDTTGRADISQTQYADSYIIQESFIDEELNAGDRVGFSNLSTNFNGDVSDFTGVSITTIKSIYTYDIID